MKSFQESSSLRIFIWSKPDAGIYRYLLETYGLIPEESLFIDDRPENIEAARELGIKGVVFDGDFDGIEKEFHL